MSKSKIYPMGGGGKPVTFTKSTAQRSYEIVLIKRMSPLKYILSQYILQDISL